MKKLLVVFALLVLFLDGCGSGSNCAPNNGNGSANPNELIQFSLDGTMGAINQVDKTITVAMPYGTSKALLTASFITTGESVMIGTTSQTSGSTSNNFTNPVTYTVHAVDGSTQNYLVTATVQPIITQATGITFSGESAFLTSNESSTITQCSVDGSGVMSNCVNLNLGSLLPNGALSISAESSGATHLATIIGNGATDGANPIVVSCPIVNGTLDIVNCTSNTITPPAGLNAGLRTTQKTNLTTTTLSSDLITSYSIKVKAGVVMAGVIDQTAKTIRVTVPYGVSLNGLVGSFTVNGANTVVKINNVTQLSGVTANNFPASSYLTYDVTPSGGATVQYQVFVRNSTFAASAMNYNQLTDTILLSFMPWFVTEQPFAITPPSPYFGYYNESTTPSFKMLGLSSIAYTDAFSGFALFYTITNIADNTTYTCDIKAAPYQIDPAKCESTTVINQPSSVVSIGANANGALTYTASYSDNKVVACASDVNISTKPYSCNDSIKTSYPEISGASAYLNYPRGMSFKFSAQLLTIVNEGDNSYVSCKIVPSGNNPTYTCTKYYFKDL